MGLLLLHVSGVSYLTLLYSRVCQCSIQEIHFLFLSTYNSCLARGLTALLQIFSLDKSISKSVFLKGSL